MFPRRLKNCIIYIFVCLALAVSHDRQLWGSVLLAKVDSVLFGDLDPLFAQNDKDNILIMAPSATTTTVEDLRQEEDGALEKSDNDELPIPVSSASHRMFPSLKGN